MSATYRGAAYRVTPPNRRPMGLDFVTEAATVSSMSHPLYTYRKARGLSQEGLGKLLGYSKITILRWENGKRQPKPVEVAKISEKTGIPPRELRPDLAELIAGEAA